MKKKEQKEVDHHIRIIIGIIASVCTGNPRNNVDTYDRDIAITIEQMENHR
jgi:hypothetical protein